MARRNTQASPGVMIFIGIIMVLFSIIIFANSSNTRKMHKRCTESTNGIVQSVTRQRRTRKSGKHSRTTYYVYLTGYEFEVDNKPIHGSSTLQSSERLSEGDHLLVYYNPSNPNAEYYTRYDDTGTGGMIASAFFGLVGVILFVSGIKTKAARRGMGSVRGMAAGAVLSGMNGNNNYNSNYNNNYNYNNTNSFNNNYNNGYNDTNSYNNNFNNGYNNNNSYNSYDSNSFNNYNNGYNNNNNHNNGFSNDYNNYNNNNVYSGSNNNYNDFNQLN